MRQIYVLSGYARRYSRFVDYVNDVLEHPKRETVETRIKIIEFFDEFGIEATRRAFGVSRATVYLWRKKLRLADGKLSSLAPQSRAPLHRRKRLVDPFIREFIIRYRTDHPRADKTSIAPVLAAACRAAGVMTISESSVGRIIHDLKARGALPGTERIRINGESGKIRVIKSRLQARKTRRKGFRPSQPGDLVQMDTVAIFADGLKRYLFTALDVTTRFAFAYAYTSNSSANGRDFLSKFSAVAPFPISRIQTDNGAEFLKHFARSCEENQLTHYFSYPHHPQSNGHLERFNRTIQEQFADWHTDLIDEPEAFNRPLMDYLLWYNTQRPHRSIGKLPPLRYYLDKFVAPEKSNMLWTLTEICTRQKIGVRMQVVYLF